MKEIPGGIIYGIFISGSENNLATFTIKSD